MERNISKLNKIVPNMQHWTAIVQVFDKQKVQISKAGNKYKKLVLVDDEGNKVDAIICKSDIEFFKDHFHLYKRYMISNARVERTQLEYQTHENQCNWIIDNSTVVEAIQEPNPPQLPLTINFTPFKKFHQHIDDNSEIDVLGVVSEVHLRTYKGTTPKREIILIDQSLMPVILTLWGDHEIDEGQTLTNMVQNMPFIAALRLKVTSYHTMNLSTKFGSSILINPPIQQASEIKTWTTKNEYQIRHLMADKAYNDRSRLLPLPDAEEMTTIRDYLQFPLQKAYWIQGTPKLLDRSQKFWYNACPRCFKSVRSIPQWPIVCASCSTRVQVSPRCRLTVQLEDYTGNMTLDLYGNDASQLLPFTIQEIQQQEQQNKLNYQAIEDSVSSSIIVCFIKKTASNYVSGTNMKYSAIIVHKLPNITDTSESSSSAISGEKNTTKMLIDSPPQPETTEFAHTPESSANVDSNLLTALKLTESPIKKQRTEI